MSEFINFFILMWQKLIDVLGSYEFDIFGTPMNLIGLFFGFILLSIVIAVFWKGARG